jgi:membrane protease YdiL (CAAX protease family)
VIICLSLLRVQALAGGVTPDRTTLLLGFGLLGAACTVALAGGRPLARPRPRLLPLLAGLVVGVALLLPGWWLRWQGHPAPGSFAPPAGFFGWIPMVALVSFAEETWLRGVVQPSLRSWLGPAGAIIAAALVFAAIHAPVYGAAAIPLDMGVGALIGLLRERLNSVAACGIAHTVADLGWWWIG